MLCDKPSTGAGGGRHTITSEILPYRTAECVYPMCARTTKLNSLLGLYAGIIYRKKRKANAPY